MKKSACLYKWLIVSLLLVCSSTALLRAQPSNSTLTGLVSWWKAEGNGLDSVGGNTAYAAFLPGGAAFAPGEVGQAFQLDDTNAYLVVPASPSLDVGASDGLTMEGWVKVSSVDGLHPIAEWDGDVRNTVGVQIWLNSWSDLSGGLFGVVVDASAGQQHRLLSPQGIMQPNVFQHVALTYDKASGVAALYLNGAVVALDNIGSFTPLTSGNLWMGHRPFDVPGDITYGTTLGGLLDEFSIYNRALSSNEIAAIYNAGSAGKSGITNSGTAPAITSQPANQTVAAGGTATFSVTATGTAPLFYQWSGPSGAISGATHSSLTLSNVQSAQAGSYFVVVTNQYGFAASSNVVLTVKTVVPSINGLILPNYSATNQIYTPDGSLNETLRMQMVYGSSEFPPHPIMITEVRWRPDLSVGGPFSITISNLQIKLSTTKANPDHLSTIFSQNIGADETVAFSGEANVSSAFTTLSNGTTVFDISIPLQTPFAYDSTKGNLLVDLRNLFGCTPPRNNIVNGTGGTDATSRVFTTNPNATNATVADTGGDVLEIIYSTTTAVPIITTQPTNQTVNFGGTARFSMTATGAAPLHYQWYGPASALIPGAVTSTLTLSNVVPDSAGAYFVLVTNTFGFAASSNALLTVTGGGGTNSCTPTPSGIAAWWPGEGNGNDIIHGNNAILESGVIFGPGEVDQAFQLLNYTNGFTHVPASPSLNIGASDGLTMEGWIKVSSVSGFHPIAEYHGNTREQTGVQIWLNSNPYQSGALLGALPDTNFVQHTLVSPAGLVQPDVFQHVALTYDKASGNATLYLNGAVVAQANFGTFEPATTYDFWMGHRPLDVPGDWTYGTTLGGSLDELSLYSRALSSNEIAAIYNAGSAGKCGGITNSGTAPAITHQPTNQTVAAGGTATFSVTATGTAPLFYQWSGPAGTISGANQSSLTLSNIQPAQSGNYFVVASNAFGMTTSSNALLTVTGGGGGTNSCTPPPSGIVAWWRAEGNAIDSINGNNGTMTPGATNAPGKVGLGFLLDGNGYASVPASSNLDIGTADGLTIEGWIKENDYNQFGGEPIIEWDSDTADGLQLFSEVGLRLYANLKDTSGNNHQIIEDTGTLSTNEFKHVALTYDKSSGMARLYVNGVEVQNANFGNITPQTTYPLNIGARTFAGWGNRFSGIIDELSLYRRALSSNEIAAIYNAGSAGKCGGDTNTGTAPMITKQPTNQTVAAGGTATFTVTATGTAPLFYQWSGPAGTISGANQSSLTLSNIQPAQSGNYFVVVSNAFGMTTSSNALLTVTGGGGGTSSCTPPPSGIAAWWPAEGNGTDIIGGNTATPQGGATYAPGEVGQAFLLNGPNDYLSVAASSNLNVAAGGSFTAEAWIKVSDVAGYHPIVEWNDGASHGGVHMWILPYTGESAGVLFANLVDTSGGSHSFHSPGGSVATNVFQHVAVTYDYATGTGTLYVNGNIVAQQFIGVFMPQTSYPFYLGHRPNIPLSEPDYGSSLGGLLDEPSLYTRALSQSEIAAIYNAGANGKCAPQGSPTPHALINPQPTINVSVSGNLPVLSWPVSAGDFTLQAADSLTAPIKWTNVPATFLTNGDTIEVTLPEDGQHGYFRLYHP